MYSSCGRHSCLFIEFLSISHVYVNKIFVLETSNSVHVHLCTMFWILLIIGSFTIILVCNAFFCVFMIIFNESLAYFVMPQIWVLAQMMHSAELQGSLCSIVTVGVLLLTLSVNLLTIVYKHLLSDLRGFIHC